VPRRPSPRRRKLHASGRRTASSSDKWSARIPIFRQPSSTEAPFSACRRAKAICSFVKRLRGMASTLLQGSECPKNLRSARISFVGQSQPFRGRRETNPFGVHEIDCAEIFICQILILVLAASQCQRPAYVKSSKRTGAELSRAKGQLHIACCHEEKSHTARSKTHWKRVRLSCLGDDDAARPRRGSRNPAPSSSISAAIRDDRGRNAVRSVGATE